MGAWVQARLDHTLGTKENMTTFWSHVYWIRHGLLCHTMTQTKTGPTRYTVPLILTGPLPLTPDH